MRIKGVFHLKRTINRIKARFPSALPVGLKELDEFSRSILALYDFPDLPSYHHSIASMIMHLDPLTISKPKVYFARSIRKAMANQVAYEKMHLLKKAQEDTKAQSEPLDVPKESPRISGIS